MGRPVTFIRIQRDKNFAFVEVRSAEEASNAIALDGIVFKDIPLKVSLVNWLILRATGRSIPVAAWPTSQWLPSLPMLLGCSLWGKSTAQLCCSAVVCSQPLPSFGAAASNAFFGWALDWVY